MGVARVAIWVDTGIEEDQCVVEPCSGSLVLGINQFIGYSQTTFGTCCFIAMYGVAKPDNCQVVQVAKEAV